MRVGRPALLILAAALAAAVVAPAPADAGRGPVGGTERVVVRLTDASDAPAVARSVAATPGAARVEPAPVVSLDVAPGQIPQLETDPRVAAVLRRGATATTTLADSVPLVGAASLWSAGATGDGKVIVVIDTGVSPSFGGTLVGQACFAATEVPNTGELAGHCGPTAEDEQAFSSTCFDLGVCDDGDPYYVLDANAGAPCSSAAKCAHGSAVAAVAARHAAPEGVAPDAGIYAIRVFNPEGTEADLVDVFLALDHVVRLIDLGMDIAVVNLSLATATLFAGACDEVLSGEINGPAFAAMFEDLRARGVAATVATGNDGVDGEIGFPACLSGGVAVGATDLNDGIAAFSNTGSVMDLVAPGAAAGGGPLAIPSGTGFSQWAGTSFAAPHVAGAFALLDEVYPKASVDQRVAHLRGTGVSVGQSRRLRMVAPAQALNAQIMFPSWASIAGTARVTAGDFDDDGHADVLAHGPGAAPDRIAYGTDDWSLSVHDHAVAGTYTPLVGQFVGAADSPEDILWYALGAPADFLWAGQPNREPLSSPLAVNGTYTPQVGDFDGDGWDDVFWYALGSPADYVWYGGALAFTSRPVSLAGAGSVAVGDFNGDDLDDLLFHTPGAGADATWLGSATKGAFLKSGVVLTSAFTLVVADVDGDLDDDVVLYQPGPGSDYLWRGGAGVGGPGTSGGFGSSSLTINGTYQPVVADLDGDDDDEILWYAPGSASDWIWFGASGTLPSRRVSVVGTYAPVAADLDADDGDEIVFVSSSSTRAPVWWSYVGAP